MALLELVRSIQSTKVTYYKVRIYHFRTTLSDYQPTTVVLVSTPKPYFSQREHARALGHPRDLLLRDLDRRHVAERRLAEDGPRSSRGLAEV